MPFYEYHCANCGHHHEELQKVGDRPLSRCPACGRNKLSRLISAPVFRLKGGGWYETDFKSEKESRRNLAVDKDHAEPKAEAAAKPPETEAKPAPTDKKPAEATAAAAGKPARPAPRKPSRSGRRPRGRRST
jgi:putative FmdB family regulatory protein